MGIILTVTAKGQDEGERQSRQPDGRALPMGRLFGRLHREGERALSIEELNEIAAACWAGER
ncbi:hypothetical protein IP70_01450 [alpha proteobacterium AAP38]|uniref:hypothetical protein n=1 Tax=Niveispirillum sp. TaxID=1917217 RepID=UPI0006B9408E|nr:hypothetical protein IP70_01450 [alpha proteobacterium AAP38]